MRRLLLAATLALATAPVFAADISVSVNQPGLFGRIDIGGGYPQPEVVYRQPVIIQRGPGYDAARPVYLHVPPGHQKNWRRYCGQYEACGQPVYFVRDSWYQNVYAPRYAREHGHYDRHDRDGRYDDRRGRGDRHDGRDDRRDDRGDGRGRGDDRGDGRGRGDNR